MRRRAAVGACLLGALLTAPPASAESAWRLAGLTERQAAAHALDRLAFGARPGEIDRVVAEGLDRWIARQLRGASEEGRLLEVLGGLGSLRLEVGDVEARYPPVARILAEAAAAGVVPADTPPQALRAGDRGAELRGKLTAFARSRGYGSQKDLVRELRAQKLLRAVYAENQLREVLTDLWFNHFNVAVSDGLARPFVTAYERDAVRPRVTGGFRQLLGATARHPAMLYYLDNALSTAAPDAATAAAREAGVPPRGRGINENYARELLELHTLGAGTGFSQTDVREVARAFTGWGTASGGVDAAAAEAVGPGPRSVVVDGGFAFRAADHDAGAKRVLGRHLPAGRGLEDGEQVLDLLAAHPATARRVATKLAVRFVADDPPSPLVERLTATYLATDGDLGTLVAVLVGSREFWEPARRGGKIKTPFELAASSLRAVGATVEDPSAVVRWVARMGQPLYDRASPAGYPDAAEYWVTPGGLHQRMSFALALAGGRIEGVSADLRGGSAVPAPESRLAALEGALAKLLPERDPAAVVVALAPLLEEPDLATRLRGRERAARRAQRRASRGRRPRLPLSPTEQIVGLVLGSPEFQRR